MVLLRLMQKASYHHPDYTTISRRINRLDIKIDKYKQKEKDNYIIIVAIDSTGIKITNRGEWMRDKWNIKRRRGYLKIHLAVDVKSKRILSVKYRFTNTIVECCLNW